MIRLALSILASPVAEAQDGAPFPVTIEVTAPPPVRFDADDEVLFDAPSNDVFGFGHEVRIGARVEDNVFAAAQVVHIDAPVAGDLFAAGEEVRIDAPVGGDVYAFGEQVVVGPLGSVGGEMFAGAREIRLAGPVGRGLRGGAGVAFIGASVGGDVDLEVGDLQFEPGAAIGGSLDYRSPTAVAGADQFVAGTVTFTQAKEDGDEPAPAPPGLLSRIAGWTFWTSWSYASKLLVGFVLLGLGGARAAAVGRELLAQPGKSLGTGFVITFVLPIASLLALMLVLPFPLGLLGFAVLAVGLYVGQLAAAQALGDLALARLRPEAVGRPYVSLAVGLVPLVVLATIPWLGTLAWLAATCAGLGALWLSSRPTPMV